MLSSIRKLSLLLMCVGCAAGADDETTPTSGGGVSWTTVTGTGGANTGGTGEGGLGGAATGGAGEGGRPSPAEAAGGGASVVVVGQCAGGRAAASWQARSMERWSTPSHRLVDGPTALPWRGSSDALAMFLTSAPGVTSSTQLLVGHRHVGASITTRAPPAMAAMGRRPSPSSTRKLQHTRCLHRELQPEQRASAPPGFVPSRPASPRWSDLVAVYAGSNGTSRRAAAAALQALRARARRRVALSPTVVTLDSGAS